jgi:hypothetical protein
MTAPSSRRNGLFFWSVFYRQPSVESCVRYVELHRGGHGRSKKNTTRNQGQAWHYAWRSRQDSAAVWPSASRERSRSAGRLGSNRTGSVEAYCGTSWRVDRHQRSRCVAPAMSSDRVLRRFEQPHRTGWTTALRQEWLRLRQPSCGHAREYGGQY